MTDKDSIRLECERIAGSVKIGGASGRLQRIADAIESTIRADRERIAELEVTVQKLQETHHRADIDVIAMAELAATESAAADIKRLTEEKNKLLAALQEAVALVGKAVALVGNVPTRSPRFSRRWLDEARVAIKECGGDL